MKLNSHVSLWNLFLSFCVAYCGALSICLSNFMPPDLLVCFVSTVCVLLLFARLGDTLGRKPALLINTLGMVVCGVLMWGTASFNITGRFVPILLSVIYGAHVAFFGGAYAGIFIRNYETGHKTVSSASYILSAGCIGIGSAFSLFKMVNSELLSKNALVALGILVIIAIWDYFKNEETTEYTAFKNSLKPLRELIKNYRFEFITSLTVTMFTLGSLALLSALICGKSRYYGLNAATAFLIVLAYIPIMISVCGKLANRIDAFKQLQYEIAALIVGSVLFGVFYSFVNRLFCFMTLHLCAIAIASSLPLCIMRMFPVSCRYSGTALACSLAATISILFPLAFIGCACHADSATGGRLLIYQICLCGMAVVLFLIPILSFSFVVKMRKRNICRLPKR